MPPRQRPLRRSDDDDDDEQHDRSAALLAVLHDDDDDHYDDRRAGSVPYRLLRLVVDRYRPPSPVQFLPVVLPLRIAQRTRYRRCVPALADAVYRDHDDDEHDDHEHHDDLDHEHDDDHDVLPAATRKSIRLWNAAMCRRRIYTRRWPVCLPIAVPARLPHDIVPRRVADVRDLHDDNDTAAVRRNLPLDVRQREFARHEPGQVAARFRGQLRRRKLPLPQPVARR